MLNVINWAEHLIQEEKETPWEGLVSYSCDGIFLAVNSQIFFFFNYYYKFVFPWFLAIKHPQV